MATLNVRVDDKLKKQASELFADLGLDMSTAVNMFLKQAVMQDGLPFKVKREVPNELTKKTIEAAEKDEDVYGPFDDVKSLMEALNA